LGQEKPEGPTDDKARKTYDKALKSLQQRDKLSAFDQFKKADKQDGGHCLPCQKEIIKFGIELGEWKAAELAAEEMLAGAHGEKDVALAHYQFAVVLLDEALQKHKEELFAHAHEESAKALAVYPNFPDAVWLDGTALAHVGQDDAAKTQFELFREDEAHR